METDNDILLEFSMTELEINQRMEILFHHKIRRQLLKGSSQLTGKKDFFMHILRQKFQII
jgi:hypothetical protein